MSELPLASEAKRISETVTIDEIIPYIKSAIKNHKETCSVPTYLLTEEINTMLKAKGYSMNRDPFREGHTKICWFDPKK